MTMPHALFVLHFIIVEPRVDIVGDYDPRGNEGLKWYLDRVNRQKK